MEEVDVKELFSKDFVTIVKKMRKDNKMKEETSGSNVKIALLGTGSLQFFSDMLRYYLYKNNISAEVFIGTYKGIELDVMDQNSEYNKFGPDVTVIFSDYRDIFCNFDMTVNEDEI